MTARALENLSNDPDLDESLAGGTALAYGGPVPRVPSRCKRAAVAGGGAGAGGGGAGGILPLAGLPSRRGGGGPSIPPTQRSVATRSLAEASIAGSPRSSSILGRDRAAPAP
ncbi:unnamed protein product, partial [Ectocarpus sp. 12 AP-2014]